MRIHTHTHIPSRQRKGEKEESGRERGKEREGWKRKENKGGVRKGICLLFLVGLYFLCVLEQTLLFWTLSFPIGKMGDLDLNYLPVHVLPKPEFDVRVPCGPGRWRGPHPDCGGDIPPLQPAGLTPGVESGLLFLRE